MKVRVTESAWETREKGWERKYVADRTFSKDIKVEKRRWMI